jgi:hypothetical protein
VFTIFLWLASAKLFFQELNKKLSKSTTCVWGSLSVLKHKTKQFKAKNEI